MRRPGTANIFFRQLEPNEGSRWRARIHGILSRLGPGWRNAPFRRLSQTFFLALYLHLFLFVCWPYAEQFSETTFSDGEYLPAHFFLLIDPLVGLSTALAGKFLNITLWWSAGILLLCLLVPRGFCGYICPLGTLIDLFDWLLGKRTVGIHLRRPGWWRNFRYYLLAGVLASSLLGFLLSGFVAAIALLTRGMMFSAGRIQLGTVKGWNHLAPVDWTFYISLGLFALVFLLGFLGKRFWCRHVCPSGALFSIFSLLRIGERKVEATCGECGLCLDECPFDAIREDHTTRTDRCTFCQNCGGACPTGSIKFVTRWNTENLKDDTDDPREREKLSRRGFLAASITGAVLALPARLGLRGSEAPGRPLRPPGSVPEDAFLDLCIRCGQCFKVCPGPVLHPAGMEYGLEALWTPVVLPPKAGCHQDCNFCTRVCPTGAIQPLPIPVKRKVHMGLARVNRTSCLPFREGGNREECQICFKECRHAGYNAIELRTIRIELDPPPPEGMFSEMELEEMSRIRVPHVREDACIGCGICEYRCHTRYVIQEKKLQESAIVVLAENEHRRFTFPRDPGDLPSPNTPVS